MSMTRERIIEAYPRLIEPLANRLTEIERQQLKMLILVWNAEGGETVRLHIGRTYVPIFSRECRRRWEACVAHGCDARTRAKFPNESAEQAKAHDLGHALTTKHGETLMVACHSRIWDEAFAVALALELWSIDHDFPERHATPEARAIIAEV